MTSVGRPRRRFRSQEQLVAAPGFSVWQQAHAVLSASLATKHVEQDHLDEAEAAAANKLLVGFGADSALLVVVAASGRLVWQQTQADLSGSFETKQVEHDHFAVFVMP